MAINLLTAIQIKNAKPGQRLDDGGGLRFIKNAGGGSWVFRYTFGGRRREMGLGPESALKLSDARKARAKWATVLHEGKDPITERQRMVAEEARRAQGAAPTFAEMVEIAFEARKAMLRDDGKAGRWLSPLRLYVIPKIGYMPVTEITQTHIHAALAPIWRKMHPTAQKALNRTSIVMKHARASQFDVDPFICEAARMMLGHVNHKPKPIAATPWREIPGLYGKLDQNRAVHRVIRLAILTAMRSDAVRGARFEEIDGDVWTIPAERMKGTEASASDFRVPLSGEALSVIKASRAAIAELDGKSIGEVAGLINPTPNNPHKPLSDVAVAKVLNGMKEPGRLHGFRTSFRTWVQDTETASYDVAETALGHIIGGKVERAYARSDLLDQRRGLMRKWADYVTQSAAKVVTPRG